MFGQDDTSSDAQNDDITAVNPTLTSSDASTPATDDSTSSTDVSPTSDSSTTPSGSPAVIEPTTEPTVDTTPEVTPTEEPATPEVTPTTNTTVEETPAEDDAPSVSSSDSDTSGADGDLLALKKQALDELSPLLDKLDQTPEEKFKTTMMMIQATDSSNLVGAAHEAALAITDEKVKAQALLDIVNEINYFTQPKDKAA